MAMIITHNISAINTQRNLNINNRMLGKSLEKLSSGYRINIGADGPADLIISEQLRAQNVGLERAVQNSQEAMNVLGIAEGALNEMNEILKKMRSLALHAANNGITSPEQVAADQSEMDSGIQTIDRIANTTKYSDQMLLNGGKELVYDRSVNIKGTQQNALLNLGQTGIEQVFKRDDYEISISFSGTAAPNATSGSGIADTKQEARKAYFEINTGATNPGDINANGALTSSQSFILTGNKGSRQFTFDSGATVGQIASAIGNVADSTGVDAALIFASDQTVNDTVGVAATGDMVGNVTGAQRAAGDVAMFNKVDTAKGITLFAGALTGVVAGKNTDGQGRIWVKYTSDTTAEFYKDSSMSKESLVGSVSSGVAGGIVAANNSGLGSGVVTIAGGLTAGTAEYLTTGGIEANNGISYTGSFTAAGGAEAFDTDFSMFSGIELGKNTDSEGKLYFKTVKSGATTGQVFAYKDSQMRAEDLVAQSAAGISLDASTTVILNEIRNDDNTAGTGLGIALATTTAWAGLAGTQVTGTVSFTNLGVRISSQDYGSDQFVKIEQQQGSVWQYYDQANVSTPTLVDAGTSGTTVQQTGQDATLSINGSQVKTQGLELDISTQDLAGTFVFNEGKVGSTTIAQVGYTDGSVYSKASFLTDTSWVAADVAGTEYGSYLTNAGHATTEYLNHFQGGMQYQLGEGAGDQERTVYSIQSMAVSNLGQVDVTDQFDDSKSVIETKTLSLQDVLGGGVASLSVDPIRALSIIDKAIEDVSGLRARLGATQSNLLQTNINSLNVSIENIQKTESAIRDADMAKETTDFTKNQILQSAATSMLAQANVMSQNVLQLLG
ncbi:MAG: hypothetical protein JXR97_06525 [Planctomycetes bacterium]|nr:hypothetical protein [Planctomycetota bacterium]